MRQQHRYQKCRWFNRFYLHQWIPLLLGIVATIAVFGLWQQFLVQEQLHIEELVRQEANAVQSELNQNLSARIQALEHMADHWQVSGGTPQILWETDAANYVKQYSGFQAVEWVAPSFQVRWVVPLQGNEKAQNFDMSQDYHRRVALQVARDLHQTRLTQTIPLAQSGKGFLACVPLFVDSNNALPGTDRFDGFIVGVLRLDPLFDSILQTAPQYQVQVFERNELIYSQGETPLSALSKTAVIQVSGLNWQVQVSPTLALIRQGQSLLPTVVLWGGLTCAWTLAFTVYLVQRSARQAQQTQKMNQQLQNEIIHRQEVEASLRESEERWQLALRGNNDGIWDWNVQTNEVFFSSRWKEMLGFADHEIANHLSEWSKRTHPDDLEWVMQVIQDHFAKKTPFYISEHRVLCKDGSYKWILDRGQALWDEAGNVTRMTGSHTDISDRKQTEIALQESQTRFAGILEIASDAIISVDTNQQITLFNKGAERIFGYKADEVLGQPLSLLIPNRFAAAHQQHVKQYAQSESNARQMAQRGAIFGRHKDGTEFPAEASIAKLNLNGETTFTTFLRDISERVQIEAERKQAELALQESEARFQAFMNNSPALAWITDQDGKIFYVNAAYCRQFQTSTHEIVGNRIAELFPAEIAQEHLKNIQRVADTQQIVEAIELAPRPDGTIGVFRVYKFPIPDESKKMFVGGVAIDVTQQQQAEEALKLSEERLQLALEASGDGLWDWNIETREIYHSPRYQEILGYDANEFALDFQGWEQTIHPDDQPWVLECLKAHLQNNSTKYTLDYRVRCKSGEWKWITDYGKVVTRDLQGNPLRMIGAYKDISDRKQAETELKHQKNLLQTIVNHIPVMIALFNAEGRIEFVNPEFERVLGWSLEEWQQRDVLLECYPDPVYYKTVIDHMITVNGKWKDFTTLTKIGQKIETSWTNVRLSNGSNLGIGQDISDRKRKEVALRRAMEAAESANLAKSNFLANMSHELRTPLNVILGFAQVMTHDTSLTPNQQEDLQTIRRSGDHLLGLINDVLDLSKIEAGHCTLEETGFDLISLLHTLRSMMAERAKSKQLQLELEVAPEVPQFVVADEQKLRQILLNLLSNAIKFTNQGRVTLRVESQESNHRICPSLSTSEHKSYLQNLTLSPSHTLQFEVIDTGVGIAETEQATIFDAFVQAEAGKKSTNGTGLGLTISRRLLGLMNGEISVHSIPDVGSTFTFTVPVCLTDGVNLSLEQCDRLVIGLAPGQPHRRILVVDDQSENRLVLVRLLTPLGLEVREATNGQDAVRIWQEWQPDLTWMDIRMPGFDGYETTKQIRAMERGQASIIIALTAQASQSDRTLALTAGCNDYISKPFQAETIFFKMREYLKLEYLYAEASSNPSLLPVDSYRTNADVSTLFDPALLAHLSTDWLATLENAAVCGDDRAIADQLSQIPPEFASFRIQLMELADKFQFEQIIQVIHSNSPP